MKNNPVRTIAEWVLIASVFMSVLFFVMLSQNSRHLRRVNTSLQKEVSIYQNTHNFFNLLMSDAVEYSKQHPDIDPLLESVGAKPSKNPAPKPAGK